jgi:uncharacterized protein GlcG (DUF336 family)
MKKQIITVGMPVLVTSLFGMVPATAQPPNQTADNVSATNVSTSAAAPQPAARGPSLELALEAARIAIDSCQTKEQKIGVTVVDAAGVVKVVLAADGASSRGVQSSTNKALTALAFKIATSQLGEKIKTDSDLANKVSANPNFNARAGGILINVGNETIGAVGVGGARGSENDEACAIAGLQKIQTRLQ